jgi:hypothetical protein
VNPTASSVSFLFRRLQWLNLPATLLLALLQRTPVVRVAASAADYALTSSPLGAVLKSAATLLGALGAVHTLAGATVLSPSTPSPASATVGTDLTVAFTVTGAQSAAGSWTIGGSVPPGLTFNPLGSTAAGVSSGIVNGATLQMNGTPTTAGSYVISLRAWERTNGSGTSTTFSYTVNVAAGANVAPAFTTQPTARSALVGGSVTFTAAASGSPTPTYQWYKNGAALSGQTAATLTLSALTLTDAATYTVVATNAAGSVTSNPVTLTVTAAVVAPVITASPTGVAVVPGQTVGLNVTATGTSPSYQWKSVASGAIAGATGPLLVLRNITAGGIYYCTVSNSAGSVDSAGAIVAVNGTATDPARIDNLSVLTSLAAGEGYFTVGTVIGPGSATGTKPILVRAAGPTLAASFGLSGTLSDPKLDLYAAGTLAASNDNWGTPASGVAALSAAFATRQAFPFTGTGSKDAALFLPTATPGSYTMQVSDAAGGTGLALIELYDNTTATFTAATPRLVNVSVLKSVPTGSYLTIGFTLSGATAKTVLIRAMGPTLAAAPFGLSGTMADPKVDLFPAGATAPSASNDNWGGDTTLLAVNNTVTFAPTATNSNDAVLLVTLPPGGYTVQVGPATGTAGGSVIAEIYEIP